MSTFKDALCLLSIFIAYGVTGRLDYEDAILLEQIQQERRHADCLMRSSSEERDALAKIDGSPFDSSPRRSDDVSSADGPCASQLL